MEIKLSEKDRKIGTYLVYGYLFFYFVRPQEIIPGLSEIRFAGVLFLCMTIWGVWHIRPYIFKTPIALIFFLGILFFISGIEAVNVASYRYSIKYITELFPQCVALYIIFNNRERILNLVHLWTVIYFLMALITISKGGLGPGDFTLDPNDASLALTMGLPIIFYAIRFLDLTKRQRYLYWLVFFTVMAGAIATNSRGGFLGLVGVILMFWWFSKKRLKIGVSVAVIMLVMGSVIISILPEEYLKEMESINDPNDPTRVERIHTWEIAWVMYKDNPIIGVGGGNFPYYAGHYQKLTSYWTGAEKSLQGRVTHSVYFQILSELGTLGSLTYLYIFIILPLKLYYLRNKIKKIDDSDNLVEMLSLALIVSMSAFAVSGTFISVAYYPHMPIWLAMYAILRRYQRSVMEDGDATKPRQYI